MTPNIYRFQLFGYREPRSVPFMDHVSSKGSLGARNRSDLVGRESHLFVLVCLLMLGLLAGWSPVVAQDFEAGKALFAQQCASCHGDRGQGNKEHYDQPLVGDLSTSELAKVIRETMPEEKPNSLSEDESMALAVYVHHEFYSSMAQLRNAPPKVELAHLTVQQFRSSLSDLMVPFIHKPQAWTETRGLNRIISNARWGKERVEFEKSIDGNLKYEWGDKPPLEKVDSDKWQIRWDGSVLAPTTGWYEFSMDANIRANFYVNGGDQPLIDASVVSFEKSENTASVFLLGGRSYPIAIDITKTKEPSAKLAIEWKIPGGVREPIPTRMLSPTWSPNQLVISTPFPPDDSSVGYERGRSISREWDDAVTAAAIEMGNALTENTKRWMPSNDNNAGDAEAVQRWCIRWVSNAFRRPLSEEEKVRYVRQHFVDGASLSTAIKKVTFLTLKSPYFQYPTLAEAPYRKLALLSLSLWDSVPEEWMIESASKGNVQSEDQVKQFVNEHLKDARSKSKLLGFFHEYLGIRYLKDLSKDSARYPDFNAQIASDLRTSLDLFLEEFSSDPNHDIRQLLTADYMYMNGRLAKLYGLELPEDAPFQKVTVPRDQRSGVLSHPYLMSGLAYHASSSPIHRGVFLAKRVLGRNLRPPVDAIIPLSEEAAPNLTTRERVNVQTAGAMCQTCHRVINPLGYSLEHYDAVGRYRTEEQGKAIDASGQYVTSSGDSIQFKGVREVAEFLSQSPEVHQSIVRQLFQYLAKQPLPAYGIERTSQLDEQFAANGFALQPLIHQLMVIATDETIGSLPNQPLAENKP